MLTIFSRVRSFIGRDFRMHEACKRLPHDQLALIRRLDEAATRFRNSLDHTAELLGGSGAHWEMAQCAAVAREERNTLVTQCATAGIPEELIEYFGSLSR